MKDEHELHIASEQFDAVLVGQSPASPTAEFDTPPATECAVPDAGGIPQISNAAFIEVLFPRPLARASALVCSKVGDPTDGGWTAIPANRLAVPLPDTSNNYVNCASFYPDADGQFKARKGNFAGAHFIMLDDFGTKVPFERIGAFEPSWLLETSLGNYQAGILFDSPITDTSLLTQLLNAIVDAGLCDPGASGPATRWARLPVGINGKAKYRSESGIPFQCRLAQWEPSRRYTVREIIEGLGLRPLDTSKPPVLSTYVSRSALRNSGEGACSDSRRLLQLRTLVEYIDPNSDRQDWLNVLMAIFHETQGSDDGLALADHWSRKGTDKYKGPKDIEVQWRSFKGDTENPITIRTLMSMAAKAGADVPTIMLEGEDEFEVCLPVVVPVSLAKPIDCSSAVHPLGRYSVSDDVEILERQAVEQVSLLGNIALMGQATMLYAAPNTGKTLIVLHLIMEAINKKILDPKMLFYINMDDNSNGLVAKARIAAEFGFEMLADGHRGFKSSDFRDAMEIMIENNTARGVVVVLDTAKKFVDTMHKGRTTEFTKVIRRFCLKGGTVIALGHTNKHRGTDGKQKYAGTSDIADDFDCYYILDTLEVSPDPERKIVEFVSGKRRGNVASTVTYSYSTVSDISYEDLLLSVEEEDFSRIRVIKEQVEFQSDLPTIEALKLSITEGINTKMSLIKAVAKKISLSERVVGKILDKYTGKDPQHYWRFEVGARGAKSYVLLTGGG